jgi:hypothetical protein
MLSISELVFSLWLWMRLSTRARTAVSSIMPALILSVSLKSNLQETLPKECPETMASHDWLFVCLWPRQEAGLSLFFDCLRQSNLTTINLAGRSLGFLQCGRRALAILA